MSRIYGENVVGELLARAPDAVVRVLAADPDRLAGGPIAEAARRAGIPIQPLPAAELRARSGGRGGAGRAADIRVAATPDLGDLANGGPTPPLLLALDGVTDPHNLGAVLRSAAAFGAGAVIVPRDNSAPLNDAAVRASAGAVAYVPLLRVVNLSRAIRALRDGGVWAWATTVDGERSLYAMDFDDPVLLVLGAEGTGIRPGVIRACDGTVRLPMAGPLGSLNVSVFAGVALSEVARQRGAPEGAAGPPKGDRFPG